MSQIKEKRGDVKSHQKIGPAISCISLAALSYTVSSIFVKLASHSVPTNFIVFVRYSIFLIFLIPVILIHPKKLKTTKIYLHLSRGLFGVLSIACFFYAIHYMNLTQAVLLSATTPLFIPIVLRFTRHIKIIPQLYWGMGIGFLGVLVILHPSSGTFNFVLLIALFSAIFRALSSSLIRQISKTDTILTILFYYFAIGTVLSGLSLFFNLRSISHIPWIYLLFVGITGACYQIFLTLAYKSASPRLVSPFIYLAVVFAALADWLIWHESLSFIVMIGIGLVFIGAMLTVYLGKKQIT